jgi:hypothetical protein
MTDQPYAGEFRWQGEPNNSLIEMWNGEEWVLVGGSEPTDKELDLWIMAQPHQQWTPTATDPIRCHELDQHEMRAFARAVLERWGRQ